MNLVYHRAEGCYWLLYLQNRFNVPIASQAHDASAVQLTDIGLASTPDGGRSWVYRGVAMGVDVPHPTRTQAMPPSGTQQYGGATWCRPAVTYHDGTYHGFWVYFQAGETAAESPGINVVHFTSPDLKNWQFNQTLRLKSYGYDSDVFRLSDGRFILVHTHAATFDSLEP